MSNCQVLDNTAFRIEGIVWFSRFIWDMLFLLHHCMKSKDVITIDPAHIEAGIKKYEGVVDPHLKTLIQSAGLKYTPYKFKDGRILLVLPNNVAAVLYASQDMLYRILSLTS
jgi:hypothetical protein